MIRFRGAYPRPRWLNYSRKRLCPRFSTVSIATWTATPQRQRDSRVSFVIRKAKIVHVGKAPYMEGGRLPLDPWGRTYQYRCPGWMNPKGYDVWSLGPDGVVSADDIGNWPENRLR